MNKQEIKQELLYLHNPMAVITDYTNKILQVLESAGPFDDHEELIRKIWEEEKAALKERMTILATEMTLLVEETNNLLEEANNLINPEKDGE